MGTAILYLAIGLGAIQISESIDNSLVQEARLERVEKALKLPECVVKPLIESEVYPGKCEE